MRARPSRWSVAVLAGVAAVASGTLPASAGVLDRGTFQESDSFQITDFCGAGLLVDSTVETSGRYQVVAQGGLPFFRENVRFVQTFTNPETGLTATGTVTTVEKDLSVMENEDGTYTVLVLLTGNDIVRDDDGRVIARNPGQVRIELLVDLGGTPLDLSDDEGEFVGVVRDSTGRNDDFCEAVLPAIT